MAAIPCDACGGKMSSDLAVCPHCGARRARTEQPRLSQDEIRALLATDPVTRAAEARHGMLHTLMWPHPGTTGGARVVEIALTVLGLPLVLAGALSLALVRRARKLPPAGGELSAALTMTVFGGLALIGQVPTVLVGASLAALWARALLRVRTGGPRRVDLQRIERPAREPVAALPEARALRDAPAAAPAAPAGPVPVTPAPARPEPPADPNDGPRLLR